MVYSILESIIGKDPIIDNCLNLTIYNATNLYDELHQN